MRAVCPRLSESDRTGLGSHLQQPGFESAVQQHIEAEDLEAGAAGGLVGKTGVVTVFEGGVGGYQRLYDDVLDVTPHLLCVAADGLQKFVEAGQFSVEQKSRSSCCEYDSL